jgi:hypothetical protein
MTRALRPSERAARQKDSGIPACWTWPLPTEKDYEDAWRAWKVPEGEREKNQRFVMMGEWQPGCAVCGLPSGRLVVDHDHGTGLARGYLCPSCNTNEPMGGAIFDRYHHVNPASICGVEFMYDLPTPRAPRNALRAS